ncbi:bifunctional 4-hydroxy-2-oxoglutarate aldolase/2-dehydro-3-deoxy-phosphogluconate aldolase [Actinoplanes sp. TBRC 11911]|uniref:bifunctional 4-hydroxy-2-oxoglutarate aldolase/2-dehydro-3-deoxy-phosphogluconate aldolase n=1 Tax=Actinoplanes sp. TBRC 11911 TaxID=2729386 RepID=UPI00145F6C7E|nr:bifunctional 4-hydroxy-2-oxoglutarate aldolase/2-dehydro-3-deoxy-phosphogluconate aldolase [Actinoplanes sp. TBRC 11911]NMO54077.1 bifunctional 4-hydroxy-2-oxoglutarate aldolase/2-dehydro-3-deoxy-phosphogluconate aldolase [Actinoplanes sp. TBRC 11911]
MSFDAIFDGQSVMAILRGLAAAETVRLAERLWDAGVTVLEVPIGAPPAVASLAAAAHAARERGLHVGAGTVITVDQVRAAATAGAQYTVAPGLDLTVSAASVAAGMPHLPGVGSATEVQRAWLAGHRWLKAFPAKALGPAWVAALRGPFPDVRFVATGGLTAGDAPAFLDAGARVVALGAALADPGQREQIGNLLHK